MPQPPQSDDHVVVIGAGPAGLTAAYQLARAGVPTTLLEAESRVGGLARTEQRGPYRFDIGPHRFFTKDPAMQALWETWLGDEMERLPRLTRIFYDGSFFDYPLRAANALAGLGPFRAVGMVASYARAQLFPSPVEETFEQWVSNRFGRRLFETFFETYTEKVWGLRCSEISADWAAQRIQNLSLGKAIWNALPLQKRRQDVKSLIHEFGYPRLGAGQMWEAAATHAEAAGARVLLEHRVREIRAADGRVTAVVAETPDGLLEIPADHVISSMPLRHLVRTLGDAVPADARAGAERLRYRDMVIVALVLDDVDLFPDHWVYIHSPDVRVGRLANFNNWSSDMVGVDGHSVIAMEYFCWSGDEVWSRDDDALIDLAARELETMGLDRGASVVEGHVVRVRGAYPVYDPGFAEALAPVQAAIDGLDNLQTVGRNGMHKYNNMDHSMITATLATDALLEGTQRDIWAVNSGSEYHEEIQSEET